MNRNRPKGRNRKQKTEMKKMDYKELRIVPKLVVGIFTARQDVSLLITDLKEQGIKEKEISVLAKDFNELKLIAEDTGLKLPESGTADKSIFGVLRTVTEVLEGARGEAAVIGAAAEKTAGAELWRSSENVAVPLIGAGIPEQDAQAYHEHAVKGHILVFVECNDEQAAEVNKRMKDHHSLSLV